MEQKKRNVAFTVIKVAVAMAIFLLLAYFVSLMSGFGPFFELSAKANAVRDLKTDIDKAAVLLNRHYENLYEIAERTVYAESKEEVDGILEEYIGSESFGDLRYFARGKEFSPNGLEITQNEASVVKELNNSTRPTCTDLYFDEAVSMDCIAFYIPVKGSEYIDGLVSIVPARGVIDASLALGENASAAILISEGGKVLASHTAAGFEYSIGNNYFDFIRHATSSAEACSELMNDAASGEVSSRIVSIGGLDYTSALGTLDGSDGKLIFISLSLCSAVTEIELEYVSHLIYVLTIALIFLVISLVYTVIFHHRAKTEQKNASLHDATLECANEEAFRRGCMETMYKNPEAKYIIFTMQIKQFHYVQTQLGEEKSTEVLKFIVEVIKNFCNENESFGYAGNGMFLIFHSFKNETTFKNRIQVLSAIINKNNILTQNSTSLSFIIGACFCFGIKKRTVKEMIECARVATESAKNDLKLPYVIYTDDVNLEVVRKEQLESKMEAALEGSEFKLFLQPKYDVKHDKINSAEALVRWFDAKRGDYRFPGEFIDLFETNGFIVKLDHFIFLEVCKYFKSAVEHGDPIVPVSVNVSRVTAVQDDFINFYIGNKKKYGIGDGFLTIEFTESFAMENYDTISGIVNKLHENGILCSIDDFGSGYSSFNILKNIPMDELKLDRFFIERGTNEQRDNKLLMTVINLAKSLGMTVVQEGVETKEMFDKICGMGCDIIQGYYYAKAIPLEEYKLFIKSNTSIKYKSRVK